MTDNLRAALKSQYHASLAMLHEAITRCPDEVWSSRAQKNAFWQIAYHTLFFTHLYLQRNEAAFRPWKDQRNVQHPDGIAEPVRELRRVMLNVADAVKWVGQRSR